MKFCDKIISPKRDYSKLRFLCFAFLFSCSPLSASYLQDYEELEILDEYYTEPVQPILVDINDRPVETVSRAAKYKDLTVAEKRQIDLRNRESKARISEDSKKVQAIIESGGDLNDPLIDRFFAGYVFPEMTRLDNLSETGEARSQFLRSYLGIRVTNPNFRNRFIDQVCLPNLKKIYENTEKNLHPSARLNAIYLLGLLDSSSGSRATAEPPVPSSTVRDELIRLANQKDALLKIGAWSGLHRHLQIDFATGGAQIPAPQKNQIKELARNLLSQSAEQNDLDLETDYWLKRRSVQALGFLRDSSSLDLMVEVLNESENKFSLKLDALEAIGQLDLNLVQRETLLSVVKFLADSLEAESAQIKQELADLIYQNMLYEDVDLEVAGKIDWDAPAGTSGTRSGMGGMGGSGRGGDSGRGGRGSSGDGQGSGGRGDRGGAGGVGGLGGADGGLGRGGAGGVGGMGGADGGLGRGGAGGVGGMGGADGGSGRGGAGRGGAGGLGGGLGGNLGQSSGGQKVNKVELPNYLLQVSRRRIKSLAFIGKQTLMPKTEVAQSDNGLFSKVESEEDRQAIRKVAERLDRLIKDANVGIVDLSARRPARRQQGSDEDQQKDDEESVTEKLFKLCEQTSDQIRKLMGIEKVSGKEIDENDSEN